MSYYIRVGHENQGPFTLEQLRTRGVQASEYVWRDGLGDWQPAGGLPELAGVLRKPSNAVKAVYAGDPASPYAPPASSGYGDYPAPYTNRGPLRQSGFGIASTLIGGATFVCAFVGLIIIGVIQEQGGNPANPSPLMIALSFGVCLGGPLFHLIGLILGIVGIFQADRSKVFGIMGTVINGLVVVGGIAFIAIAVLIGMSVGR